MYRSVILALAAVIGTLVVGPSGESQEKKEPPKEPEKSPWELLKDPQAKAAKAEYDAAVEKARKEYEGKLVEARKALAVGLKDLEVAATKSGDLDRALSVRAAKTAADLLPVTLDGSTPGVRAGAIVLKGIQYRVYMGVYRWDAARARCKKLGGDLAVLDTPEKRAFIAKEVSGSIMHIGAFKEATGRWVWVNNKPITADAWVPGRPAKFGPKGHIFDTGLLGDETDGDPDPNIRGYICEWPAR